MGQGEVSIIASDHAPHLREEKEKPYQEAPSGVPGLETTLPLLLDAASKGRLSLQQIAALSAANPAKIFGLQGKGEIRLGFDADFVLVYMKKEHEIDADGLFTKCKWSPFEGWKLKGKIERVFLRGEQVFDGENIAAKLGRAKHIPAMA